MHGEGVDPDQPPCHSMCEKHEINFDRYSLGVVNVHSPAQINIMLIEDMGNSQIK